MKRRVSALSVLICACASSHVADRTVLAEGVTDKEVAGDAAGGFENNLRAAFSLNGQPGPKWQLTNRMKHYEVPGVSIAIIRNWEVVYTKGYGYKEAEASRRVDTETVFSVGSVSKLGAAALALRLADLGKLNLERDVNSDLQSWTVPNNEFTNKTPVTLRHILSHTSGLSVHGFPDFGPDEDLPTVFDTLEGRPPAKNLPVQPLFLAGSASRYSGGGVTVQQLLIAEKTGQDFASAAKQYVFEPLGMLRSTYENPLPPSYGNIAKAHDRQGNLTALPRGWHSFPEMAASGMWTTALDLSTLIIALMNSYRFSEGQFLNNNTAVDMMTEVGPSRFGLGPQLIGEARGRRFYHGGSNESYKAWVEGHLETGDGLVVLTNSANGTDLYYEIRRAVADTLGWPFYEETILTKQIAAGIGDALMSGTYVVQSMDVSARRLMATTPIERVEVLISPGGALSFDLVGLTSTPSRLHRVAPLKFIAENLYSGTPEQLRVEFVRQSRTKISKLILHRGPYSLEAHKE